MAETKFILTDNHRELVELERVAELIAAQAVTSPELIQSVKLSNKSFSADAAAVLAATLQTFENVTHADLSDVIAGRPEEEALQVLRHLCDAFLGRTLHTVDLSDNALGSKGIHACRTALENQSNLQELFICNNGLAAESAALIAELLLHQTPTKLAKFHFYNNMSGDQGGVNLAPIVSASPLLTDLRFSATRAGEVGSTAIAEAMKNLDSIVKLDLCDNTFGEDGTGVLAQALEKQTQLEELNLRYNSLGPEGTIRILEALKTSGCPLKVLDLSSNDIGSEAVEQLCEFIAQKPTLEVLGLEENELGTDGAKMLAESLQELRHIREVLLQSNEITAAGAVAVTKALLDKPLVKLELDGNAICAEGLERIESLLTSVDKRAALGAMEDNDEDGENDLEAEEGVNELDELVEETKKLNI